MRGKSWLRAHKRHVSTKLTGIIRISRHFQAASRYEDIRSNVSAFELSSMIIVWRFAQLCIARYDDSLSKEHGHRRESEKRFALEEEFNEIESLLLRIEG